VLLLLPNPQVGAYPMPPTPAPMQQEECFNVQWLLFIIGWFIWPVSLVACFLPLCTGRRGARFPTKCYKSGWIANVVLSIVSTALMVVLIVLVCTGAAVATGYSYRTSYYYG
jgi:heme/copper-type cytochrome/quinol oxidase subunit 2